MRRTTCQFVFSLFIGVVTQLAGIGAAEAADDFIPGELVVLLSDEYVPAIQPNGGGYTTSYSELDDVFTAYSVEAALPLFSSASAMKNIFLLRFPVEEDLDEIVSELSGLEFVEAVEKNWLLPVNVTPNDYHFNHDSNGDGQLDQWTYYKMQLNRAWGITTGDSTVIAAVIDTGLDWQATDLAGRVWINTEEDINENGAFDNYAEGSGGDLNGVDDDGNGFVDDVIGWDFYSWDNDPYPSLGDRGNHGTAMNSIVAAETNNNGFGIAGATWHTKLMGLKAGAGSSISFGGAVGAINYAIDNGASIVNMSFSSTFDYGPLHTAIQDGDAAGLIFVGSASDNNNQTPYYPGSYNEVIRVAVVDSLKYKTLGSSYGTDIDICAPAAQTSYPHRGVIVCTFDTLATATYQDDDPPHIFGFTQLATSGGAAEVTASVALLRAFYPDSSTSFVKGELFRGAEDLPDALFSQGKLGAGMVNPYRSLSRWGVIASDTTWGEASTASTVYVSGDVTVADGTTLTIAAGTVLKIAQDDNEEDGVDTDRVEFSVDGELVVAGTSANPVVVEAWNGQGPGDWVGFYISSDSEGATFEHCTIRGAEIAIDSYAPVTLRGVTIEDVSAAAVSMTGATLTVDESTIGPSDGDCIRLDDSAATIDSTTAEGYFAYGVYSSGNYALNVTNSSFLGDSIAVYVSNNTSNGVIANSTFESNHTAISYYASIEPDIDECTITGNNVGVRCDYYSSPMIEHCITSASYAGEIDENGAAVFCTDHSDPGIGSCSISANETGVGAFDESEPTLNGYGANRLVSNADYHVVNTSQGITINARVNYWYQNTGAPNYYPKASKILGSVDYTGALGSGPNPTSPRPLPAPEPVIVTGLGRAHPNPFNPTIQIPYSLNEATDVEIDVFDVSGRLVRTLVNERRDRGQYVVVWDGVGNRGTPTASAVYFVRMRAGTFVKTQKIVLIK